MSKTARKHPLGLLVAAVVLLLCGYINREHLERGVIAYRVYQSRIFTPPLPLPGESRWNRFLAHAEFYWDFSDFVVARQKRLKRFDPIVRPLVKEIGRRQAAGDGMQHSMHIYREVRWRLNFTHDDEATMARIADLRQSLSDPEQQELTGGQQSPDGSWGLGINVWYLKFYYSVDDVLDCSAAPKYRLSFLDRINSPEKLTAQLDSDLMNDFTKTGVFNREELDETFSGLARLLFGSKQTGCYAFEPQLKDALREFVVRWQNPATGTWGQWLMDRRGRIWKMDDMGMTFHVVSDLQGQVDHKDMIAKRLLELDRTEFPAGIQFDGHYENHLNWDAVTIFRYAWPTLDDGTRQEVRAEISRMLDWCLTKSYQPDGSFRVSDLDDTPGDAYRYGVWFLRDAGYFRREDRFWSDQDFPDAEVVRDRIEAKLKSIGSNDAGLKDAYDTLQSLN